MWNRRALRSCSSVAAASRSCCWCLKACSGEGDLGSKVEPWRSRERPTQHYELVILPTARLLLRLTAFQACPPSPTISTVPALALRRQISFPHEPTTPLLALSGAFPLAYISLSMVRESLTSDLPWSERCTLKRLSSPAARVTILTGESEALQGFPGGRATWQTEKGSPRPLLDPRKLGDAYQPKCPRAPCTICS